MQFASPKSRVNKKWSGRISRDSEEMYISNSVTLSSRCALGEHQTRCLALVNRLLGLGGSQSASFEYISKRARLAVTSRAVDAVAALLARTGTVRTNCTPAATGRSS